MPIAISVGSDQFYMCCHEITTANGRFTGAASKAEAGHANANMTVETTEIGDPIIA